MTLRRDRLRVFLRAVVAGLLLAASLPPWGWWPLAFVGLVMLDRLIADQPVWSRFRRGWLVAAGLLFPTLSWLITFTAPGYVIAAAYYAGVFALACMACPPTAPGRWIAPARRVDARRGHSEVDGPSAASRYHGSPWAKSTVRSSHAVRIGGTLLLDLARRCSRCRARGRVRRANGGSRSAPVCSSPVSWCGVRSLRPATTSVRCGWRWCKAAGRRALGSSRPIRPSCSSATSTRTDAVQQPVDMVLWPEDVVNIEGSGHQQQGRSSAVRRSPAGCTRTCSSVWSRATATGSTTRRWRSIPRATSSTGTKRCGGFRSVSTCRCAGCSSPSPAAH